MQKIRAWLEADFLPEALLDSIRSLPVLKQNALRRKIEKGRRKLLALDRLLFLVPEYGIDILESAG